VRILKFAGVSGAGLLLDYAIYTTLCMSGMPAGFANLISAGTAVTMVFLVSARHIFEGGGGFMVRLFVFYALYQVLAVSAASAAVHAATDLFDGRYILGKTIVVPFSFTFNYLFMSWLFATRDREPGARRA
jgi:putative flippase GtrA